GAASVDGQTFDSASAVRWRAGAAPPAASPLLSADSDRIAAWIAPPPHAPGLGQLLVRNGRTKAIERLNVARYHVNVVLRPPLALVQIDQAFFNPHAAEREGTFAIDLPPGAAVSRFAMYVANDRLIEGELVERQRAVDIHQTIIRGRPERTPPELAGDNLFQMRVFPLPGRDVKRVLLDYTIPLTADGSHYRFHLPLSADPLSSEVEPIFDFRLTGEIQPFASKITADDVTSASHPELVRQGQADGSVAFSLAHRQYPPPAEFVVSFPAAREQPLTAVRSSRAQGRADDATEDDCYYFLAQISRRGWMPPVAPADVLILVDTSSDITEHDAVRQVATSIVKNLRREDRFQLDCVDVACRPLTKSWVVPDSSAASAACAAIDRQIFLGETDLIGCFKQAVEAAFASSQGRRRVVIYIGDGVNTVSDGAHDRDALAERLDEALKDAGAALAVYLVPLTVPSNSPQFAALSAARGEPLSALQIATHRAALNAPLRSANRMNFLRLAPIARASGGVVFDGWHPAQAAGELFQWLLSGLPTRPRLNKIDVEGGRPEELHYLPDAVGDGSIQLLGRTTRPGRAKLTLSLTEGQQQPSVEVYEIEIAAHVDDTFLGRLWAQRRVDELAATTPQSNSPELAEIIELSQEWSLLSPYTAFLVLEAESDYARWKIDHGRRRRYWQPAEALATITPLPAWLRPPDESPPDQRLADQQAQAAEFEKLLAPARESLAQGNYQGAWARLEALRPLPSAGASREFGELTKGALAGLRRASLVDRLGAHRRLIDPLANLDPLGRAFEPDRLVWASCSPEFLRTQPHADRWLEELAVFPDSWTLQEWATLLADCSGVSVALDRKALGAAGIDEGTRLEVVGYGRLSLRSLLRHAFRRAGIVVIDEPHRFLITSRLAEEDRLATHVYPVADLLTPGKSADLGLLADPYLDREQAARRRISARLAQPISLSYSGTPLRKVIEQFAARLNAAVVIDVEAVQAACIGLTMPITGAWHDVPLRESLRWALDDLDLTYTLRDEALLITSKAEAENLLRVDLHSGRGLVYEFLTPVGPDGQPLGGRGTGMGMGGGLFGFRRGFGAEPPPARPVGISFEPAAQYPTHAVQTAFQMAALGQPFAGSRLLGDASAAKPGGVFVPDASTVIGLVHSTIEPTAWDELGGPGTVRFFDPTLDFAFGATDDVHEQIERLFASLRNLPQVESQAPEGLVRGGLGGEIARHRGQIARLAEMRKDAKEIWRRDLKSLTELITTSIEPATWDEVGGPGTIGEDLPRLALVVMQTQEVHGGVVRLLTLLRRSRYAATHDDRPWEADFLTGLSFNALAGAANPSAEQRPVDPAALAVLAAVRREPREGSWRWEHSRGRAAAESIGLRRQEGRMELFLGEPSV
ncbi:MAG TPA: VIT and VWA domain-containing protein, partial [Pirellulales bacterium]|nr:VIT and VWA domain-containing protein [Pirellulales bacterium]